MANDSRFDVPVKTLDGFAIFGLQAGRPYLDPAALQAHYRHRLGPLVFENNWEWGLDASRFIEVTFDVSSSSQCNTRWEELLLWNSTRSNLSIGLIAGCLPTLASSFSLSITATIGIFYSVTDALIDALNWRKARGRCLQRSGQDRRRRRSWNIAWRKFRQKARISPSCRRNDKTLFRMQSIQPQQENDVLQSAEEWCKFDEDDTARL